MLSNPGTYMTPSLVELSLLKKEIDMFRPLGSIKDLLCKGVATPPWTLVPPPETADPGENVACWLRKTTKEIIDLCK